MNHNNQALRKYWRKDILDQHNLKGWSKKIVGGENTLDDSPNNGWGYIADMFILMDQLIREDKDNVKSDKIIDN